MASKKSEAACQKAYASEYARRVRVHAELCTAIQASGRNVFADKAFSYIQLDEKGYPVTTELTVNVLFPVSEDTSIVKTSVTLARYAEVASQITSLIKDVPTLQSEYGPVSLADMKVTTSNKNMSGYVHGDTVPVIWVQFSAKHAITQEEI
jgi:hypothetical protein